MDCRAMDIRPTDRYYRACPMRWTAKPPDAAMPLQPTDPAHRSDPCDGTYTCGCIHCRADVARRVEIGIRATRHPIKRAA